MIEKTDKIQDEISLAELLAVLRRYRALIGGMTLTAIVVTGVIAGVMTPVYRAEVLLAPVSSESSGLSGLAGQVGGLASLVGVNIGGGDSQTSEAVALLQSTRLTEMFVQNNNLLPVLYPALWDAAAKKWLVDDPEDVPTLNDAALLFEKKLRSVSEDKATGLITFSLEFSDRELVVQWVNELVRRTNALMRQESIDQAERSLKYLDTQLAQTTVVDVRQSIYGLIEGQIKAIMLAKGREDFALKVVDPPVVSDVEGYVRPKPVLMVTIGGLLGAVLGVFLAFLLNALTFVRRNESD